MHITQPTLSRQIKSLEDELGQKLFIRHSFSIELTEAGLLFRKQAEDLLAMANKIYDGFHAMDDIIGGDIYLGLAESYQVGFLADHIRDFKIKYPNLRYHITSGDTEQVLEKLDSGLLDFAAIVEMIPVILLHTSTSRHKHSYKKNYKACRSRSISHFLILSISNS